MTREHLKRTIVALVFVFLSSAASAQVPLAPDQALPVDPNVMIGTLENGLTYYIRPNTQPENRAQGLCLVERLDTFCHHTQPHPVRERNQPRDQRPVVGIVRESIHEAAIDFDAVEG